MVPLTAQRQKMNRCALQIFNELNSTCAQIIKFNLLYSTINQFKRTILVNATFQLYIICCPKHYFLI